MKMILLLIIFSLLSCDKDYENEKEEKPTIIWRKQLGPQFYDQIAQDPGLYRNKLIFGYQTQIKSGYYIFDKSNGNILKDIEEVASFEPFSVLNENLYYSNFGKKDFRVINLDNYQIQYFSQQQDDFVALGVIPYKDYLFAPTSARDSINNNIFKWKITSKSSPSVWEVLYAGQFIKDGGVFGSFTSSLSFDTNNFGEEIMLFASFKAYNAAAKKGKYKVSAFNLSKKKLEWETEEFELDIHHNNSLGRNSIITETQFIVSLGSTQLMSFDKKTGKLLWSTSIIDMTFTNYYEKNGKISFLTDNGVLHMVDASSGKVISKKDGFIGNTTNWQFHKGIMYFTTASNKLYGVDAQTHEIKVELSSPNLDNCSYCGFFFASPVVDPATNRLYISDRKEVICYQLPK